MFAIEFPVACSEIDPAGCRGKKPDAYMLKCRPVSHRFWHVPAPDSAFRGASEPAESNLTDDLEFGLGL